MQRGIGWQQLIDLLIRLANIYGNERITQQEYAQYLIDAHKAQCMLGKVLWTATNELEKRIECINHKE